LDIEIEYIVHGVHSSCGGHRFPAPDHQTHYIERDIRTKYVVIPVWLGVEYAKDHLVIVQMA
jgi:hypothetical protein